MREGAREGSAAVSEKVQPVRQLQGEDIILTPVTADDAERVYDAAQDIEFTRWLEWAADGYTWDEALDFVTNYAPNSWASGQPVWAIRPLDERGRAGPLAGVIDIRETLGAHEIGFWMHRDSRGKGWMSQACQLVVQAAFDHLGAERILHHAAVGNEPSRRIARNLGFVPEGVRRFETEGGKVETQWQSALLLHDWKKRKEDETVPSYPSVPPAKVLPGDRPSDLVAEFHSVYGMPNLVEEGATPSVDFERVHMRMALIQEEITELIAAVYGPQAASRVEQTFADLPDEGTRDVVEAADALADLTYVVYGMALESGINLDKVLAEVHSSNLSKLMPDGSVRRREDGKILKGPNFREPDIAGALKEEA